ncbi:MAG: hypothetical protein JRD19_04245 [Deltaproteobacteria bacterium]|nr:hypothetical protein [Deltaproteobacteria bacterium]
MSNKNMLASPIPVIKDLSQDNSTAAGAGNAIKWSVALKKAWHYVTGKNKEKVLEPDPAVAIIQQIEDREVARIVRDLHYRTPKSLEAMRNACESCFVLPDDCAYYDYSIFDVRKAIKRLTVQPAHTHQKVVVELQKINQELANHLAEYLE